MLVGRRAQGRQTRHNISTYHQLSTHNALGETRKVLNIGSRSQLTTGSNTVCHETLIENGLQLSASQVNGGRVGSGPRADNDDLAMHPSGCDLGNLGGLFRVLLETGGSKCSKRKARCACAEDSSSKGRGKQFGGVVDSERVSSDLRGHGAQGTRQDETRRQNATEYRGEAYLDAIRMAGVGLMMGLVQKRRGGFGRNTTSKQIRSRIFYVFIYDAWVCCWLYSDCNDRGFFGILLTTISNIFFLPKLRRQ